MAAGILVAANAPMACAQIATLDKGHQILVNNGLQIWGLDQGASGFNYNNLANANFNGVMWSFGLDPSPHPKLSSLSTGQKWGKWMDPNGSPATALDAIETSKKADLIALQVGDEQQSDLESPNGPTKAWLLSAQAGNYFPDQLLYVNSFFINSDAAYATFIATANPDAISFDAYPFDSPYGALIYPQNWLSKAGQFRRHALGSYIGPGGNTPRPYGLYLQTYASSSEGARDPGDLEMRWQQFTAWTMGFTFVDAFTVGGSSSLFNGGNMSSPTEPRYSQFKETARQGRNLGPALTRLISYGYGPSIVVGKNAAGVPNPVPSDWLVFNKSNAPLNQQYLASISATNIGTKNSGQPGDVYIGFFNPLLTSYGDPAGTTYFMATNALGPYLDDASATVAECLQQLTLDFDFGASKVNSLQRLRRSDGQVEVVPLTYLSANLYRLTFDLEGGTGDLFKYNDGTPFVGVQTSTMNFWDNDANAANNNVNTGAGLGGSGTWDTAANKWFNGSANAPWATNNNAVFGGTAGTVTLSAPQSANSLTFKTSGYSLTGSTLTMNGSYVTAEASVSATINSAIAGSAGLIKNGPGTLNLTASNSYTGGTSVIGGTVVVASDANLGAVPGSFTAGNLTLNGGTLRFGANTDISNNRGITIGAGGGTIDTQAFSNSSAGYNASQGGFRGPGDLTKLGSGTFFASNIGGGFNTTWTGRLIIKEGTWKIVATDGLPYNAPLADGLQADQVTLDGGTWQIGGNVGATSARRGVTIAAGGGTIDTQSFNLTWAGPWAGSVASAVLNKIGGGTLRLNTGALGPGTYAGILNVNGGALQLDGGTAMGDLAAVNLANVAGVNLSITPTTGTPVNEVIGSLAGGGTAGGNLNLNFNTLTVGANNNSTTFAGVISGSGGLTKSGTGVMTLTAANSYGGSTTVAGGTLAVDGSINGGALVQNGGTLAGSGTIGGAVTVQSGGHLSPGNSPGTITIGGLTLLNGAFLHTEIGPVSDKVIVGGNLAVGGTLDVSLDSGFTPGVGQSFTLLTANAVNGTFGTEALPAFSNRTFDVIYNAQSVVLKVVPILPGDFNSDTRVDAADYGVWRRGLGTTFTQADYDTWRAHFGEASASSVSLDAVPEPAAWILLSIGGAALLARLRWLSLPARI